MRDSRGLFLKRAVAYLLMLAAAGGTLFLIHRWGGGFSSRMPGPMRPGSAPQAAGGGDTLVHVLVVMIVVLAASALIAWLLRGLSQPPVMGEILAGIVLGPSVLGRISPETMSTLLPPQILPGLAAIAHIGLILYMFLVGLELDLRVLRQRSHASVAISHASIALPFILGAGLALWLYPRFAPASVPFTAFMLFVGVAMSITAFPVLARILTDRGLQRHPIGTTALACAAVDDVTAWCLLAVVVSVVQSRTGGLVRTVVLSAGFILLVFLVVRPAVARLVASYERRSRSDSTMPAVVFVAILLSALATEFIGIHSLFGAFVLGATVPAESALGRDLRRSMMDVATKLLLPAFFALTGLRTAFQVLSGPEHVFACALIVLCASVGKFGGTFLASRVSGFGWRESSALGVLMNTRGLMELIVLNIGLELGVLSPALFTMFVVMAVVTTLATGPIMSWLGYDERYAPRTVIPVPEVRGALAK